jgi:hypothetical protein
VVIELDFATTQSCNVAPLNYLWKLVCRYGTHMKRLKDPEGLISLFLERATRLGDDFLGPILVQVSIASFDIHGNERMLVSSAHFHLRVLVLYRFDDASSPSCILCSFLRSSNWISKGWAPFWKGYQSDIAGQWSFEIQAGCVMRYTQAFELMAFHSVYTITKTLPYPTQRWNKLQDFL